MKRTLLLCLSAVIFLTFNCKKSGDKSNVHIHCDNLVNETIPASDQGRVFVANAFTPNGDGLNDLFRPLSIQISSIKVKVYDGNSNLLFETTQVNTGWNLGAQSANKKFYYRIEAVTVNNTKIGLCGEVNALACFPRNVSSSSFSFEDQITPNGFTGVTNEKLTICN